MTFAQQEDLSSRKHTYIEQLFYQGDYYRVVTEIMRRDFSGMGNPMKEKLLLTKSYYFLGDYYLVQEEAKRILLHSAIDRKDQQEAGKWLTFSYLMTEKRDHAEAVWNRWVSDQNSIDFPQSENSLPGYVDPIQAKLLSSFLPGSGFLLTGSYNKAFSSFFLNALFIAGVVHYWKERNYGIAGLLLFFEFNWYFGGREASEENAREYNHKQWIKHRDQWIEQKIKSEIP